MSLLYYTWYPMLPCVWMNTHAESALTLNWYRSCFVQMKCPDKCWNKLKELVIWWVWELSVFYKGRYIPMFLKTTTAIKFGILQLEIHPLEIIFTLFYPFIHFKLVFWLRAPVYKDYCNLINLVMMMDSGCCTL